jgi:ribosome-binding protein aMBF1 (putative translation factor)
MSAGILLPATAITARRSAAKNRRALRARRAACAFSQWLRTARELAGVTQEELAARAQIDRTYPSLLERGLREPTLSVLCQLAAALDITPAELMHRVDQRESRKQREASI